MLFCCCFVREAVNRKSIWTRNNKVTRQFSCFQAPNARCSATGKKVHLDLFQRLRVFLCCCKEDSSEEEGQTSPSYLNTNAFLGSYKCRLCVDIRFEAFRSGLSNTRSVWPVRFTRAVGQSEKRLKEIDRCVCFGGFVSRSYLQPWGGPPWHHRHTEMFKVIVEQVIWGSPGGPEEKVLLLML